MASSYLKLPDYEKSKVHDDIERALVLVQDLIRWYNFPEDVNSSLALIVDELRYTKNSLTREE